MSSARRISPLERQRQIVARVADGSVDVETLARELGVSEISVRRDLVTLEKQGRLLRVYGGAISNERVAFEFSFKDKESRNQSGKAAVARAAIELVEPGMSVYIDTGTTALAVARILRAKRPNVIITINLGVASEYVGQRDVRVLVPGGELNPVSPDLYGEWTLDLLSKVTVDLAFFGCDGVLPKEGFFAVDTRSAGVSRLMLSRSRQSWLLADSSKFGHSAMCTIAPLTALTGIVTDSGLSAEFRRTLKEMKVGLKIG